MSTPFLYSKESEIFVESLNEFIFKINRQKMSAYMSSENMFTLHHGNSFSSIADNESALIKHTVNLDFEYSNIRLYKIEFFYRFIEDFIEQISSQMENTMFKTIGDSCDKSGNVVDTKQKIMTNPEAFLEVLQKIEFSVNKDGEVLLPTMYLHPSKSQKFMEDLKAQGEDFQNKIEEIKKEKSEQALKKEKQRLEKFEGISIE